MFVVFHATVRVIFLFFFFDHFVYKFAAYVCYFMEKWDGEKTNLSLINVKINKTF